jgi:hypothetical protein
LSIGRRRSPHRRAERGDVCRRRAAKEGRISKKEDRTLQGRRGEWKRLFQGRKEGYFKEGRKNISRRRGGGKEGRLFQGGKKGHFKEKRKNTQRKEGRRCIYISRARARK